MKFFSSSSKSRDSFLPPAEIALLDSWTVIDGNYGGQRMVGVLRDGVTPLMGHPSYRQQVGIALILENPGQDGMPGPAESEHIYELEDAIQASLEEHNQSLLVAKWFVRGCRELVFYTSDVKAMSRRVDEIASRGTRNQIQLTTNSDPDWKVLRSFAPAA